MSINTADYPNYAGLSPNRTSRQQDASPDYEDWDQVVAELLAMQDAIGGTFNAINDEGSALVPGNVVYVKTDGTIALADADGAAALRQVVGLVEVGGADGASCRVRYLGKLVLTLAEWDAVGTDANGLDTGLPYFMADTPGEITTTAPATAADDVFKVGVPISATTMLVNGPAGFKLITL